MCYWKVERECLKTYQCVHIIVRRPDRKISPWTTVSLAQHSIGQADGECVLLAILLRCYTVCCRRSIIVTIATAFYGETQMQNRSARHHSYRQPHQFTSVTIFFSNNTLQRRPNLFAALFIYGGFSMFTQSGPKSNPL